MKQTSKARVIVLTMLIARARLGKSRRNTMGVTGAGMGGLKALVDIFRQRMVVLGAQEPLALQVVGVIRAESATCRRKEG